MRTFIRVTRTFPWKGSVPEEARKALVGLELPVMADEEVLREGVTFDVDDPNNGGYVVRGAHAVQALIAAGKAEAARCWSAPWTLSHIQIARRCCKVT